MKELNLQVERLEQRIAPGLLVDCVTVPTITVPSTDCTSGTDSGSTDTSPPPDSCPPPDSTSSGGNNGYGNGGEDGVPGSSADNNAPNADEKAADEVR